MINLFMVLQCIATILITGCFVTGIVLILRTMEKYAVRVLLVWIAMYSFLLTIFYA